MTAPAPLNYYTAEPAERRPRWFAHLRSPQVVASILIALAEVALLALYCRIALLMPVAALASLLLAGKFRTALIQAYMWLLGGATAIFLTAPLLASIAFAYPAFLGMAIAIAQSGRILAALVSTLTVCVVATFFLDTFQSQMGSSGKKVIVVAEMWASGENKQPIFEDVFRKFEEKYPEYKVQVRWDGRWVLSKNRPRLLTGKDIPDLIEGGKDEIQILVQENYALPLDRYLPLPSPETGRPWREDWNPMFLDLGRYRLDPRLPGYKDLNGKMALATGILYDYVYFYNKTIARRLGIESPPQTWDQFLVACQKAKDAGIEPIVMDADYLPLLPGVLLQRSVDEDTMRATVAGTPGCKKFTDETYLRIFRLERELDDKYLMRGWQSSQGPKAQQEFANGKGLYLLCGSWLPGEIKTTAVTDPNIFKLGSMPFPHFNDEPGGIPVINPSGWIVLKAGSQTEGAIRLLQFMSNNWGRQIAEKDGNLVAFARDPIPPDLMDLSDELKNMTRIACSLTTLYAPKWATYVFTQLHEDFMLPKPGDPNYMTAEEFARKLQEKTAAYQKRGGEKFWE